MFPKESEDKTYLSFIILKCDRLKPNQWFGEVYCSESRKRIEKETTLDEPNKIIKCTPLNLKMDCSFFIEFMEDLKNIIYISAFRNAINQGSGKYYDLDIGTSFIETWNTWKAGDDKNKVNSVIKAQNDIKKIFDYKDLDIYASINRKHLQGIINNKPYKLKEIGSGITQFIIVFGNAMIKKPSFILIDEPEINLHPSLQVDFLTSLASYANKGIIYATHSIGLARTTADYIYSFKENDDGILVDKFEETKELSEFIGEMSFSAYNDLGYNKILLVEGVTDVRTFQQFLRKLKKDHKIIIIPLGGDSLINKDRANELSEIKRITSEINIIIDSEKENKDASIPPNRLAFEKECEKLNINILITEKRAIENYLSDRAIKRIFSSKYQQLEPYELLKESKNSWGKTDNWKIAREMEWEEIKNTDVGSFLESL